MSFEWLHTQNNTMKETATGEAANTTFHQTCRATKAGDLPWSSWAGLVMQKFPAHFAGLLRIKISD
jgi:hypothetical protein